MPVIRLKRVVFPAPFGPMTEVSLPSSIARLSESVARSPPKFFVSPSVARMTMSRSSPYRRIVCFLPPISPRIPLGMKRITRTNIMP